jgi:hypothetical protein
LMERFAFNWYALLLASQQLALGNDHPTRSRPFFMFGNDC